MANKSLPNSLIKIKMCIAPGCDEFAKGRFGYCPFHQQRIVRGIPFGRPKYARSSNQSTQHKRLLELWSKGHTQTEIAQILGLSSQRVSQIIRRSNAPSARQMKRKLSARIWKQYLLGFKVAELADQFKKSSSFISNAISIEKKSLTPDERAAAHRKLQESKFWRSTNIQVNTEECWVWQGGCHQNGYGRVRFSGRSDWAHRIAFEIHHGYRPTLHVLHSCDNPPCVNPHHLREGTMADNMKDRDMRGRSAWQKDYEGWMEKLRKGQQERTDPRCRKLSDEQVDELRRRYAAGESARQLGSEFNVHFSSVARIARGDTRQRDRNGDPFPLYPPSKKVHKLFRDKYAEKNG